LRPLGVPHANRLLKDNFALDPDLLLYFFADVQPLIVNKYILWTAAFDLADLFHRTIVFSGLIVEQFNQLAPVDLHPRNSRQQALVDLHLREILTFFALLLHVFLHDVTIIITCLTGIPGLPHRGSPWRFLSRMAQPPRGVLASGVHSPSSIHSPPAVLSRTLPVFSVTSNAPLSPAPPR
jgi:hypothetical protein